MKMNKTIRALVNELARTAIGSHPSCRSGAMSPDDLQAVQRTLRARTTLDVIHGKLSVRTLLQRELAVRKTFSKLEEVLREYGSNRLKGEAAVQADLARGLAAAIANDPALVDLVRVVQEGKYKPIQGIFKTAGAVYSLLRVVAKAQLGDGEANQLLDRLERGAAVQEDAEPRSEESSDESGPTIPPKLGYE